MPLTMGIESPQAVARMAEDKAMILDLPKWPLGVSLMLKTQPWVEGEQLFGHLHITDVFDNKFIVYKNTPPCTVLEQADSLDELVKRWSVD